MTKKDKVVIQLLDGINTIRKEFDTWEEAEKWAEEHGYKEL